MKFVSRTLVVFIFAVTATFSAEPGNQSSSTKKIGVLLVCHGSRSESWRKALMALEDSVRPSLLQKNGPIAGVRTAYMEYTEPSIATQMKALDAEGYTDVVIVPVFLSVSGHTFDDIPTIIGKKKSPNSIETLKMEQLERYTPKANTYMTPTLDFTDILKKNILRRFRALSRTPADEGLVMIAYGDQTYEKEWSDLLDSIGVDVQRTTGITDYSYGWCGHLVHYESGKTTEAIGKILPMKKKAVVIPVLVAFDETFQIKIIGSGISRVSDNKTCVVYKPDSILPDENVQRWVIAIAREYSAKIQNNEISSLQ